MREKTKPTCTDDRRIFEIACSFPALKKKGVADGSIPGISPEEFHDGHLAEYLYNGPGRALSQGVFKILEFLLNLFSPYCHDKFNLGDALRTFDPIVDP